MAAGKYLEALQRSEGWMLSAHPMQNGCNLAKGSSLSGRREGRAGNAFGLSVCLALNS